MAPLPKMDLLAIKIKDLLHLGKREDALSMIEKATAEGTAGEETMKIAEYLRIAGKGRQPFGKTHLWYQIGVVNDELRDAGMGYDDRCEELGKLYGLNKTQISTALGKYERALDEIRIIDEENFIR